MSFVKKSVNIDIYLLVQQKKLRSTLTKEITQNVINENFLYSLWYRPQLLIYIIDIY